MRHFFHRSCPRDEKRGLDLRKFCRDGPTVQYRERGVFLGGADWTSYGWRHVATFHPPPPSPPSVLFPQLFLQARYAIPHGSSREGEKHDHRSLVGSCGAYEINRKIISNSIRESSRASATLHPSRKRPSLPYLHNWCSPNMIIRSYWHPRYQPSHPYL